MFLKYILYIFLIYFLAYLKKFYKAYQLTELHETYISQKNISRSPYCKTLTCFLYVILRYFSSMKQIES